ncbi:MAG: 4Fe-4S dicluster domain-containing protein [Bacillota bacterium]
MKNAQITLYIDTKRCMNCRACEIACKLEHDLPVGPRYTMVTETDLMVEGEPKSMFLPTPCLHCGDAPCLSACPAGAISKRSDGIVLVNKDKCIGCHECLWACPFGIPQFGSDGKMEKCTLCAHRVDEGDRPACDRACPAEAILVGTTAEISETLRRRYAGTAFTKTLLGAAAQGR